MTSIRQHVTLQKELLLTICSSKNQTTSFNQNLNIQLHFSMLKGFSLKDFMNNKGKSLKNQNQNLKKQNRNVMSLKNSKNQNQSVIPLKRLKNQLEKLNNQNRNFLKSLKNQNQNVLSLKIRKMKTQRNSTNLIIQFVILQKRLQVIKRKRKTKRQDIQIRISQKMEKSYNQISCNKKKTIYLFDFLHWVFNRRDFVCWWWSHKIKIDETLIICRILSEFAFFLY